jgi:hypothetical protein
MVEMVDTSRLRGFEGMRGFSFSICEGCLFSKLAFAESKPSF